MQETLRTELGEKTAVSRKREMSQEEHQLLCPLRRIIEDAKGMRIKVLDIREQSNFAEYVILAEGYVSRHLVSIAYELSMYIKKKTHGPLLLEGVKEGDWAVLSYELVLIHLLTPDARDYYQLEELYSSAVDLSCKVPLCRDSQ